MLPLTTNGDRLPSGMDDDSGMKPGGTDGGSALFMFGTGFLLAALGAYFFFDSVNVRTDGGGLISGGMRGRRGGSGGMGATTSMGILFVPFVISVIALFYDASKRWAWGLFSISNVILAIEILSRIRFHVDTKLTHLLLIFVMFAAGIGFLLRSFRDFNRISSSRGDDGDNGSGKIVGTSHFDPMPKPGEKRQKSDDK